MLLLSSTAVGSTVRSAVTRVQHVQLLHVHERCGIAVLLLLVKIVVQWYKRYSTRLWLFGTTATHEDCGSMSQLLPMKTVVQRSTATHQDCGSTAIIGVEVWGFSAISFLRQRRAHNVVRAHQECLMKEIRVASNIITCSAPTINPTADAPIPESASGCG